MNKKQYLEKIKSIDPRSPGYIKAIFEIDPPKEYSDKIDAALEPDAHNNKNLPRWVRNIRNNLNKSVFKVYQHLSSSHDDPYDLGFQIGAARELKEYLFKSFKNLEELTGIKVDSDEVESYEKDFRMVEGLERKTKKELSSLTSSYQSKFHKGISDGLVAIFTEDGLMKGEKENTKISLLLLISWPILHDTIKTRRQLYDWLIICLGSNQVGEFKRIEQMLMRIKFSPAKPGRPKKAH